MPIKWMANDPIENPTVELGTIDKVIFERLDYLKMLGINCIELLPVEDSSQTLDWGYGTRFFFAPDYDIGSPIDLKYFVKSCHETGIRVILDVVMNFSDKACPLNSSAPAWFYDPDGTDGRNPWGGRLFKFNTFSHDAVYEAREFLYGMAEFWVTEYHIDGFRIDDFADIQNWEFGQTFRIRATAASTALDPAKPFIVIAEDSFNRFQLTNGDALNTKPVFDAIWNFNYMWEIRRLVVDSMDNRDSRSNRVWHLLSKDGPWNDYNGSFDQGFTDMRNAICYATSHDVQNNPRMMNVILGNIIRGQQLGAGDTNNIKSIVDGPQTDPRIAGAVQFALYRILGCFALLLTSVGIPMFLAGEEFGDVHDLPNEDGELKQQDPVQWKRADYSGQKNLLGKVGELIALRTAHRALQMNDINCFYFHPTFNQAIGTRVFAYVRTAGLTLGSAGQVIVIANLGSEKLPVFGVPDWPWGGMALTEIAHWGNTPAPAYDGAGTLNLFLDAFQVRAFKT
jgi:1,4-alpha-glucan branching enzyme